MKKIYIVRHCEAEGQEADATLTENGFEQALKLSEFFSDVPIDRIISSPYLRAIESIRPLAKRLDKEIEMDQRLTERILSSNEFSDWYEKLRATFQDFELMYEGGESSNEAMQRIVNVAKEMIRSDADNTVIVTHGNLMSLLLNYYDKRFGLAAWNNLSNPDVFLLKVEYAHATFERLWRQEN